MTTPDLVDGYLQLTRRALTPSAELRERVQARLQVDPAPVAQPPSLAVAEPRSSSLLRRQAASLALSGTLLALGFIAGYALRPDPGAPPPLPRPSHAVDFDLEAPSDTRAVPGWAPPAALAREPAANTLPAPRARKPGATARPQLEPQPDPTPLVGRGPNEELALLARAERAVRADNSALALVLIDELDARFPSSGLLEERRALELLAHCVARASDARQRAERFLRQHPRTVYAERIAALCPSEP
jgi:hypothetical protein